MSTQTPTPFDYPRFVAGLKDRIHSARLLAAGAVNKELVGLYCDIGKAICDQQSSRGWGDAIVDQLARDPKAAFPGTTGFSATNLWCMPLLHKTYTTPEELLSQLVREMAKGPGGKKSKPASLITSTHADVAQSREPIGAWCLSAIAVI